MCLRFLYVKDFNPPTPCGVGHYALVRVRSEEELFQSTHPVRGGTAINHKFNSAIYAKHIKHTYIHSKLV